MTSSPSLPDGFQRYRCNEVHHVPKKPGLYAWYGVVHVGPPDWELSMRDGHDQGETNTRRLLQKYTHQHRNPALSLTGRGSFSTLWEGELLDQSALKLRHTLGETELEDLLVDDAESDAPERAPKLQTTVATPVLRKALWQVLGAAQPVLSAPVYIGVAKDLHQRVGKHVRVLRRLWGSVSANPEELGSIVNNPIHRKQFAVRAISQGFTPDTLQVWTLSLTDLVDDELDEHQARTLAEAAEWLLNRWHRPSLGRR